jgi:crotonobetaine/carnitine-CoA ligase
VSATSRATFAGRWHDAVASEHERPFLVFEDDQGDIARWSYDEFDALVAAVAGGLRARGVRPGCAVHLALTNSPAFVATWLATALLGAWVVPSDPKATAPELAGHVARTRPVVGVCSRERAAVYAEGAAGGPEVVVVDEADPAVAELVHAPVAWHDVARPSPRDRAAVMFTSGTTAAPKGVVVTQANYAFAGDVMAAAAGLRREHRQFVVLPMFHANAQYYSFASAISAGASVALMHGFSATGFLTQAARHRATHASLFAAPMRMMLARGATPVDDVSLVHCWYAQNVTDDQYEELSTLLKCRPRQLYGMTETIPAVLTNPATRPIPNAMGVPTLGCDVDVRTPESNDPVDDGGVGEVVVRGVAGITLFDGYLDDPDTTARSFRAGAFRTGDLARRDADGYLYFEGRRTDVLKVAGENVSVVEVEAVLSAHPAVLEAAIVGQPDEIRDEVPVGYVVQQPGKAEIRVEDLERWCEERLAKSKRPVRIVVVDELPRTSVGKIRKFMLEQAAREHR